MTPRIKNNTGLKKKLFIIGLPIDKSMDAKSAVAYIDSIKKRLPSEHEVFEGEYTYKFIIIPSQSFNIISLSDVTSETIEKVYKKVEDIVNGTVDIDVIKGIKNVGNFVPSAIPSIW